MTDSPEEQPVTPDPDVPAAGSRSAEHSADPTQPEEGFDVGARTEPPDTDVGRFDTGIADTQAPEAQREGRFDDGVADTDAPDKQREGRFDDGTPG